MSKRTKDDSTDADSLIKSTNIDLDKCLKLDKEDLTTILAHIANQAGITMTLFKKARVELPSFSTVKWAKFAEQLGLPQNVEARELEPFVTPRYRLPRSLQEAMFENAWRSQDVYREKVDHTREEAKVRILEPYIVPIVALFQGRVIDKPEQPMDKTEYSTGGEVEHEIFIISGVLFFVIEFKLNAPDANNMAQMFLEFLSAAKMNAQINLEGLRIYGLLTNLVQFRFYSYDPIALQFCFDETIIIDNKRPGAFSDMMDVSNKIFGVVLSGYKDSLRACIARSNAKRNKQQGQYIPSSSQRPTGTGKNHSGRTSIDQWEAALVLADSCCAKFEEPTMSLSDIDNKVNEALALLTKSVRSIPRASTFTGGYDPSTPAELKALAARVATETYERYLKTNELLVQA